MIAFNRHQWVLPVLIASCSFVVSGCGGEEQAPAALLEVKVVAALQKDVPLYKEWVGQTLGSSDVEIRARVDGWLQGLHFQEGSEVRRGALLYTIDQTELQQRVAESRAKLAQARTALVRAESDVNRYRPLAAAGAVSKRDLEIAEAEFEAATEEVSAAQAGLRLAEVDLGYATIHSPISGLIGISAARPGDYVGKPPNAIILNTVSDIDTMRVRFAITENEYLDLVRRLEADTLGSKRPKAALDMILANGQMHPEKGWVLFTERRIDPSTGTLLIEAAFPNPTKSLRPGQFARVRAVFEQLKSAIVVPSRTLFELQGQQVLYIVDAEGKARFKRVVAGSVVGALTVIEQGITAGDRVIIEGIQRVRPDMPVTATEIPFPADSTFTGQAAQES